MNIKISGTVTDGAKRGRKIGFPTANITLNPDYKVENGVYAAKVVLDGITFGGVANVGTHPTVDESRTTLLEVHIFDFTSDIYGKKIEIILIEKIRDEQRFETMEALTKAIEKDCKTAREILNKYQHN
ncbi:MAG: riboflavin kinase [Rikenellaceae bacterium]|nr:riboflavin kinase [Rikenellaceae bacterium]